VQGYRTFLEIGGVKMQANELGEGQRVAAVVVGDIGNALRIGQLCVVGDTRDFDRNIVVGVMA
jgi:hypothetical protein